jgi:iron only hydrogenase large subunit-like protein
MQKLQKVEISLSDCLACSGCITSAESVLVTQQSQEEILRVFEENKALKNVIQLKVFIVQSNRFDSRKAEAAQRNSS